jgi:hypothetical protein
MENIKKGAAKRSFLLLWLDSRLVQSIIQNCNVCFVGKDYNMLISGFYTAQSRPQVAVDGKVSLMIER